MKSTRVLITGAGGFLGSYLVHSVPDGFECFGAYRSEIPKEQNGPSILLDVARHQAIERTLSDLRPDVVVHCAALSGEADCRRDAEYTQAVNTDSAGVIGNWCARNGAHMVFTSTDLVFDGREGQYSESAETRSLLLYGRSKIRAEALISPMDHVLIARLPLLYGIGRYHRKGMLPAFIAQCKEGRPVALFTDEFRSPAYAEDVAAFLWKCISERIGGVLHLGGRERWSRHALGLAFAAGLELPAEHITETTRAALGMADRPADTSLDSSKAYAMGFSPSTVVEAMKKIKKELPL